ncbi:FAD-binding oxidoreductase [Kribbella sp. CA-293567]|uniref:FAD-binding oxidoreductase n=1 Tax=Kribbella sp. CA-293567 TaxID=3002436 RepID=UPI0022DD3A96|nr:FAD-binding oxidoreductase [Kribbella sp. CA-293567]WBQ08033.1 FAD-binding oxidoreductase [Kribbella sp. CA-293567]
MSPVDRRTVLKAGGAIAALALTGAAEVLPAGAGAGNLAGATAGPDWAGFQKSIKGTVYLPGKPGYPTVRQLFNPRWDTIAPAGVVRTANATDVQKAINFARKNKLVSVPKSGGHSYVGASTVSKGLVVDVSAMRSMSYSGNVLTVGAGAKLYDVHAFLDKYGKSLPTGTCPTVGIAGLTLGGGMGVHTRAFGLTCDRIQSLGVITADGVARNVSATSDPDLFWALRGGGGGNLGIVTSFRLITIPAAKLGFFRLTWPEAKAADVVRGWQKFAVAAPIASWGNLHIDAKSNGTLSIHVLGISTTGNGAAAAAELESYVGSKAATRSFAVRSHMEAVNYLGGGATSPRQGFLAGSDVLKPMSAPTITALLGAVKAAARVKLPASAILDPLGGQSAKIPSGGSSWGHRSAVGVVQWYTGLAAHPTSAQLKAAQTFISNGHKAVRPSTAGGYVNYVETGRSVSTYYGANYARLQAVRKKYDPTNFFHNAYTIA